MGNLALRAEAGVQNITGGLIGENLLKSLRDEISDEKVFKTIFRENVFIDEMPSYNETILPAWEFRFGKELIQGHDQLHIGSINSRILFPNELLGKVSFHRKVALAVGRFFKAPRRNLFKAVSGLTEIGDDLDITYDTLFVHGGISVPSIVFSIPFIFDVRRYRIENPCTPLDEALDADLIKEWRIFIEVKNENKEILIAESELK